ncbi:hypothetical protein NK718_16165 [Alsobacter sp. SYSU M60028]|uniref:Uncharacterized protein n=1 Tax=Alsobacter ponti TaxID=2962936 RepID=A0ABT1LEZ3_9HYPH|nr:hypothetical protein [Alsobacter ponti]MCP8940062.1 hypothetical protein [Alsobacter ponti]
MTRFALATLLLGSTLSALPATAEMRSFIVPANDGYGVADCLADGSACGRIVADAWCRAQGMGAAASFGPSDPVEVTAAIARAGATSERTYTITCNE